MRGYNRRLLPMMRMLAEVVYTNVFTMRDPQGKTVEQMFPLLFQYDDEDDFLPISEEEQQKLQAEMDAINAQLAEKSE